LGRETRENNTSCKKRERVFSVWRRTFRTRQWGVKEAKAFSIVVERGVVIIKPSPTEKRE